LQDDESLDETLSVMAELATGPIDAKEIDVAFLVYPRIGIGRAELDRFMSAVRAADGARYELGKIPFALAAFHPDANPDVGNAERLIPFLRRTPDPTIQLTRAATLDRVRGNAPQGSSFVDPRTLGANALRPMPPPLRERIARTNLETVERMSIAELTRRLDDIRRDREETYAALRTSELGGSTATR
jgi:hypothetical protein